MSKVSLNDFHMKRQEMETQVQRSCKISHNRWLPPPVNVVKINFDGAVFSKENKSGVGVVVKDVKGLVLTSCAKVMQQASEAVDIESLAVATALSFARDPGFQCVVLKGDLMEVIQALRENAQSLTLIGLLLEDVRMLSQNFEQVLYSHTKREGKENYDPLPYSPVVQHQVNYPSSTFIEAWHMSQTRGIRQVLG
ncbi:uncharacterized protein LOC142625399 [Castanea sativa]|uniref:uncharacterized protein LOC142625399 n=1 Tax=Castanea sativa TaxID=21020 RepID=UPI003F64E633